MTNALEPPMLSHVGLYVHDINLMVAFYTTLFGLRITDRGHGQVLKNELVFLSAHPNHHHQLVLASGRPAESPSTVMQLSFKASAVGELRRICAEAPTVGGSEFIPLNHGNSLSLYFSDPEGNTVEVYVDTPFYVAQPRAVPLDLTKTDEEILRETEAACRVDPSFSSAAEWRGRFAVPGAGV